MMAKSEMAKHVVDTLCKNCTYSSVTTATSMHNCYFMFY